MMLNRADPSSISPLLHVLIEGIYMELSFYAASKAAVNTITKVMAMELWAYEIRVNSTSPGLLKSEITRSLRQKDWFKAVAMKTVPLRTYGESNPALTSVTRYLIHDSYMCWEILLLLKQVKLLTICYFRC